MPIPALLKIDGSDRKVLPLGRYLATLDEVESSYVTGLSDKRRDIWRAFNDCLSIARNAAPGLAEVWIGGSFITSKEDPSDIDVVFLFTKDYFDVATSGDNLNAKIVLSVLTKSSVIDRLHPLVDGYALIVPPTEYDVAGEFETIYAKQRGYWDQFWSKTRFCDEDNNRWKFPASGYLEVIIDGYGDHAKGIDG